MTSATLLFDPLLGDLKRASRGDKQAARALVTKISPKLFRTAYRLLNNEADAEEATQETLIKLWKIANDWKSGNAKIETWCFRVISNYCFDKLRAQKRYIYDELDENMAITNEDGENSLIWGQLSNQIDKALEKLPARQKAAIILTYFEGLGAKDVAATLETSIEAVESLLSRAKRALKQILSDEDPNFQEYILKFAIV
jgi:RNA polymerase sigma factor (sigma-70 family)